MKRLNTYINCLVIILIAYTNQAQAQFKLLPNNGQWEEGVLFKAELSACNLFVSKGQITYLFYNSEQLNEAQHEQKFDGQLEMHAIKVNFLGANPAAVYSGIGQSVEYYNYFIGNNPQKWKSKVYAHSKLYISNIYNNIDFELFEEKGALKYNFIVKPGGDYKQIKLQYDGADSLFIQNGVLNIKTRFGYINELRPFVYEQASQGDLPINSQYVLEGNTMHFEINGKRNVSNALIIDPVLVFSSYSGSRADNFGYTATFDSKGRGIAGGTVFGFGFPTTSGAYQVDFAGGDEEDTDIGYVDRDCGISVYQADGKSLLYCTYLGGSMSNDQPHSMIVDSKDNLLVMGTTKSFDFPIGIAPAFDDSYNGLSDIFIVKFSQDGTQLLLGTFVGGSSYDGLNGDRPTKTTSPLLYNYADDFRGEIIVDTLDDVYVATTTMSKDFPTLNASDNSYGGKQDGCVFKLSADLSTLLFSTYIGGNEDDAAYGLDLGTHNDLYITGGSNTINFNYSVPGLAQINNGGRADGFLVRIDLSNFNLLAATFIGTSAYDQTYFVKVDKYGKPFVFGQSEGQHARSPNVFGVDGSRMFLKKLDLNCTAIELQTVFGGTNKLRPDISPTALLVDECERIFIAGWGGINLGGFTGGGTTNMPITSDAYQKSTDGEDFYLAVFSKGFNELQYATYIGGKSTPSVSAHEHVDGGTSRFDKKGVVYQSVCAGCGGQSLFPTTQGVWSKTNNSRNCNNALFKFDFENLNRKPIAKDSFMEVF
ncbi:MAG: SBBP repeat-containing protein, partial [Bacteroidia bacterium]|nr:SBBP repeat-containing protein [Bacteroidia bacterium]